MNGEAERANAGITVRPYHSGDLAAVRRCVIELQDFERTIDPRLRPGDAMADDYWQRILSRCRESNGRAFVAVDDREVVGLIAVLAAEPFMELDDPPGTYGLVTDLVVLAPYRRRGIGKMLLTQAETFARTAGATELRIGVLAANAGARRLYVGCGFVTYSEILTKRLSPRQ
jgi:ribosomal protein S18 acetylase RimI-like enzyme